MATTIKDVLLRATGDVNDARRSLEDLSEQIRRVPNTKTTEFQIRQAKADRQIKAFEKKLREIDRSRVAPEVSVQIGKALLDLETMRARLAALPKNTTLDVNVRREVSGELLAIERGVLGVGRGLEATLPRTRTFGQAMGALTQTIKSTTPVMNGLGILLAVKLVPGLIALAGAAGGAITGLLGIAGAAASTLGPIGALIALLSGRLKAVQEARTAREAAAAEAARNTAQGTDAASLAADRRRSAENGLRDALQARTAAERNVQEAQRLAGAAITAADQAQIDAKERLELANADLEQAGVDAYQAIEDAAEAARDAVLDVASAENDVAQASLDVRQAQLALKQLRQEAGASGDVISDLFRKFTDVDADTSGLAAALEKALPGGDATQKLDLEQAILNVQKAKIREKQATDSLDDSERDLADARQLANKYAREGVAAFEPLGAAQRAVRDATRDLSAATAEANRLNKLGIDQAPGVIAAQDAMRDAQERLTEARRDARRVRADTGQTEAQARAQELTDKLTASEQRYLVALERTQAFLRGTFGATTDAVFNGMSAVLARLPALVTPLRNEFEELGGAVGFALRNLGASLVVNQDALEQITGSAAQLVRTLAGRALASAIGIFANFARAVLPVAERAADDLARALQNVNTNLNSASGRSRLTGIFAALLPVVEDVVRLAANLGAALVDAFVVVAPFARDLIGFLADGVKEFRRWINSAKGQEDVKEFFQDTLPLVKSIIKFIVQLGITFLRAFKAFSPILKPTVDLFTNLLKILDFVLMLIGKIPTPLRTIIGLFLGFGLIGRLLGVAGAALSRIGEALSVAGRFGGQLLARLGSIIERVGVFLASAAGKAAKAGLSIALQLAGGIAHGAGQVLGVVGDLVSTVVGGLRDAAVASLGIGGRIIRLLVRGVRDGLGVAASVAGLIWTTIRDAFTSIVTRITNAGLWVVEQFASGVRAAVGVVTDVGGLLLQGLIDGFTAIGREAFDAIKGLANSIVDAVKDVLGIHSPSRVMYELGQHMLAGLIKGFTSGDVLAFIREHLGGIPSLAAQLAKSAVIDLPLSIARKLPGLGVDAAKGLIGGAGDLIGLAAGGLVTGPTRALIGEGRDREAVLPLNRNVMRQLARALAAQLRFPVPPLMGAGTLPAFAPAGMGGAGLPPIQIDRIEVSAPGGQLPDHRAAAVGLGRELERRYGGTPRQS